MKPESAAYLDKARDLLERAPALLAQQFTDEAGRAAYFAGFHAAQAFIFEKTHRSLKTHSGVQAEFARLAKSEPSIDEGCALFSGVPTV
jgi:uncharacterized protein (UPF0332 family)